MNVAPVQTIILGLQIFLDLGTSQKLSEIIGDFMAFFWTKFNFLAKRPPFAYNMSYMNIVRKRLSSEIELSRSIFSASCDGLDFSYTV